MQFKDTKWFLCSVIGNKDSRSKTVEPKFCNTVFLFDTRLNWISSKAKSAEMRYDTIAYDVGNVNRNCKNTLRREKLSSRKSVSRKCRMKSNQVFEFWIQSTVTIALNNFFCCGTYQKFLVDSFLWNLVERSFKKERCYCTF